MMADGDYPGRDRDRQPDPAYYPPSPAPDPYAQQDYRWPFGSGSEGAWDPPSAPPAVAPAAAARRPRTGTVIGAAALTAVLVGGGAGYGGALLAERGSATPAAGSSASPTSSGSSVPPALPPGQTGSTVEVAKRLLPSTVMIEVGQGAGSGFVLDREGHVMTNNHVVAGAADGDRIRVVFSDGRRISATLVGRSPSYDLAVIKVKASPDLQPVQTGQSEGLQVGQPVVAIGSPLGLPGTVTQGIVSAVNRPVVVNESSSADAATAYINGIQTDAPINPGNSGGPLVDASARVIGVNSAILTIGSGQGGQTGNIGLGFAIPVQQASVIGKLLIDDGRATFPVIGASVQDASGGVELTGVEAGGAARTSGLRTGDLVTQIDDRDVRTSEELIVAIRTKRPGETVTLSYTRGSDRRSAQVVLGSKVG